MTRAALALVPLLLAGCGPDVTGWTGAWTCSGTLNTGRLPVVVAGTVTVTADARFAFRGTEQGAASPVYTADLLATAAAPASASAQGPVSADLASAPSDGCTRQLTVDEASFTRAGDALQGFVRGTARSTCANGGAVSESFRLEGGCTR